MGSETKQAVTSMYSDGDINFYSNHTDTHRRLLMTVQPLVMSILDEIPVSDQTEFTICDFGTCDGGASYPMISSIIGHVRNSAGDELPIKVVYEDQAINDFNCLIRRVNGCTTKASSSSFEIFPNVFVFYSGTSFYKRCFPPKSLDIAISFNALHWLSKGSSMQSRRIFEVSNLNPPSQVKAQAAKDWETFLLARANELKIGGRLILGVSCVNDNGQSTGRDPLKVYATLDFMTKIWKEMADYGLISQDEYQRTHFDSFERSLEELSAPFNNEHTSVSKAGLQLVSLTCHVISCAFYDKWMEGYISPERHAKNYVASLRTWTNNTFRDGLSNTRTDAEKSLILNQLYERFEDAVSSNPESHLMDSVVALVDIKRI